MNKPNLLHLSTGGTISWKCPEYHEIEKLANIFHDNLDFKKFIVDSFQARCLYEHQTVCSKDSREMIDSDRKTIIKSIETAYQKGIKLFLITHGTYTMPETWKYLEENLPKNILEDISVVITGAMYPWNILGSDAPMNIWAAISSLLNANEPLWIIISMHGKNWNVNNIEKDVWKLLFHVNIK